MNQHFFSGRLILTLLALAFLSLPIQGQVSGEGPFFGNGLHNGWADPTSIVLWTRLTASPEGLLDGAKFLVPDKETLARLEKYPDPEEIMKAQMPNGKTLADMDGACPGMAGQVQLSYHPEGQPSKNITLPWMEVDPARDYTRQWALSGLVPGTRYRVMLKARKDPDGAISDSLSGSFLLPPPPGDAQRISFTLVSCHDYNRRDDHGNGHLIYRAMATDDPDFYVHTGDIEYYDKQEPYSLTRELMFFRWNRLFALPFQRDFYRTTTTYFMKDDHDSLKDDAYPGTRYGMLTYEAGMRIFDEIEFPSHEPRYKTVRWGKDLQIWLLEGRNYRSPNTMPDGPEKTILGQAQKDWLFRTLEGSDATFKVVISPSPILGPDRDAKRDNLSNANFQHEGDEIRAFLDQFDNVFICNGDRHWQYVTHPEGTRLWEFGTGSGADQHAGGWSQDDVRPEHRFLRVKGGYLYGEVFREDGEASLVFEHRDVNGKVVHTETFSREVSGGK